MTTPRVLSHHLLRLLIGALLLVAVPLDAVALSLGDVLVLSRLGDPVEVEIPVLQWQEIDLATARVGAGTADDFRNFGLERSALVDSLDFNVVGPGLDGNVRILVSSRQPVAEPFLELIVVLRWPGGSMLREFVLLFDPPPALVVQPAPLPSPATPPEPLPLPAAPETAGPSPSPETTVAPPPPAQVPPATAVSAPEPPVTVPEPATRPPGGPSPVDFRATTAVEVQAVNRARRTVPQTGRGQHVVTVEDTLWNIARANVPRGEEADWYQYMLALHTLNPGAFVNGNLALLRAGEALELPARQDLARIPRDTARAEFERRWALDTAGFSVAMEDEPPAPATPPAPPVLQPAAPESDASRDIPQEVASPLAPVDPGNRTVVLAPADPAPVPAADGNAPATSDAFATDAAPGPDVAPPPETAVATAGGTDVADGVAAPDAPGTVIAPARTPLVGGGPDVDAIIQGRQQRLEELEEMVVLMRVRMQEAQAVAAELNTALAREMERRADRERAWRGSTLALSAIVTVLLATLVAAVVLLLRMHAQLGAQRQLLLARPVTPLTLRLREMEAHEAREGAPAPDLPVVDDVPPGFGPAER